MNKWTQQRLRRAMYQRQWKSLSQGIVEVFTVLAMMWLGYLLLGLIYSLF